MAHPSPSAPVDVLARRVRQVRTRREITAQQLADRLRAVGVAWDRATVTKLETGRRQNVTLVEWLALARVLDVAPVHLLIEPEVPGPDSDDQAASLYEVTPGAPQPRSQARSWVRGMQPLPGTDLRTFYSEVPAGEWGHQWVLVSRDADLDAPIKDLHKWARAGYGGYGNPDIVGGGRGESR